MTTVTAGRAPYFLDLACGRLIVAEMRRLHEAGYVDSLAWVLMPDHVHWLFQLGRRASLSEVMKLFKARSARQINRLWARQGSVWQKAFHDHALREEEDLRDIAQYIVTNPLRARMVERLGDYPLWDAVWL
jgi:putative transposase